MTMHDRYGDMMDTPGYKPEPPPPVPASSRPTYIAVIGPLMENPVGGLRVAVLAADQLFAYGFVPYLPQLSYFYELVSPRTGGDWLAYFARWFEKCDAGVRVLDDVDSPAANEMARVLTAYGKNVYPNMARFFEELGLGGAPGVA